MIGWIAALPGLSILAAFGWACIQGERHRSKLRDKFIEQEIRFAYLSGLQAGWDDDDDDDDDDD